MKTPAQILASQFSANLRAALSPEQVLGAVLANTLETNPAICHSHDYCDANVTMAEAFETVMGRPVDLQSDADGLLWSDAWEIARRNAFVP